MSMRRVARTLTVLASAVLASLAIGAGSAVATPSGPAPAPAVSPCAPAARACFSVGAKKAWLTDGAGHVTYGPVPALGGTAAYPTPIGVFRVGLKDAHHVSNLFTPGSMPNSVFFAPAIAFHQGSLGEPSHGCVHLSRAASQAFFAGLHGGDQVQVVR